MVRLIKQTGVLLACLFLLSQCGGENYTYTPEHELKPGPGLLSGEDGEFNLITSGEDKKEESAEKQDSTPKKTDEVNPK